MACLFYLFIFVYSLFIIAVFGILYVYVSVVLGRAPVLIYILSSMLFICTYDGGLAMMSFKKKRLERNKTPHHAEPGDVPGGLISRAVELTSMWCLSDHADVRNRELS